MSLCFKTRLQVAVDHPGEKTAKDCSCPSDELHHLVSLLGLLTMAPPVNLASSLLELGLLTMAPPVNLASSLLDLGGRHLVLLVLLAHPRSFRGSHLKLAAAPHGS